MIVSQYYRVESASGGVQCSYREFIRQARKLLSTKGKSRGSRQLRHEWLREGLSLLTDHKTMVRELRL